MIIKFCVFVVSVVSRAGRCQVGPVGCADVTLETRAEDGTSLMVA